MKVALWTVGIFGVLALGWWILTILPASSTPRDYAGAARVSGDRMPKSR